MNALRSFAAALALAAAVPADAQAPAVRFGIVGDMPYNALEEPGFEQLLKAFDAEPFDFVVHIGDFKGGTSDCSDALFDARRRQFDAAAHPFVYTPGDNEWTDCARLLAGRHDPLERLARLRALFAPPGVTLGRRTLKVERQEAYPENARWAAGPAVFATRGRCPMKPARATPPTSPGCGNCSPPRARGRPVAWRSLPRRTSSADFPGRPRRTRRSGRSLAHSPAKSPPFPARCCS
jgi:hypothetical protein